MFQAKEYQIVLIGVLVVLIEGADLPLLDLIEPLEPETDATPPSALQQNTRLNGIWNCLATHSGSNKSRCHNVHRKAEKTILNTSKFTDQSRAKLPAKEHLSFD